MNIRHKSSTRRREGGAILVLVVVALVGLVGIAGLALDASHLVLNKSRLQSTVDAAALASAKVLDQTGDTAQATAAGQSVYDANADQFAELDTAAAVNLTFQYSATLNPFVAGTGPAQYVRARATNFTFISTLTRALGINSLTTGASAVAGPSPTISSACNVTPLMVCGAPGAANYGYQTGNVVALKTSTGDPSNWRVGTGNFQLVDWGNGGSAIRENLAGGYNECLDAQSLNANGIPTQTGNVIGPTADGLNMRFGLPGGGNLSATQYPPDVVTTQPTPALEFYAVGRPQSPNWVTETGVYSDRTLITSSSQLNFNYQTYLQRTASAVQAGLPGVPLRREIAVAVGDCSTPVSGSSTNVPFLGFACFFVLQALPNGNAGGEAYIYGEYIQSCAAGGVPGPAPGAGPGPYRIQLYRDFQSVDS